MFRVALQNEYPPISDVHPKVQPLLSGCFKEASIRATAVDLLNIVCSILLSPVED